MAPESRGKLGDLIRLRHRLVKDPAGRQVKILDDSQALLLADEFQCHVHDVYVEALSLGICPFRYIRNRESISLKEQLELARARVAIVGAGGLGGNVILLLARLGVGCLVVVDYDVFDETNLNRQVLSSEHTLGKSKAEESVAIVRSINPGVDIIAHGVRLNPANEFEILHESDVVVDGLDNMTDRLILEGATKRMGIPLVHGALAGLEGQLMTIFPQDSGLSSLYGSEWIEADRHTRPESILGVPTLMPSLLASLQAGEVFKIILKRGRPFRNVMVHIDLESGRIDEFFLDDEQFRGVREEERDER